MTIPNGHDLLTMAAAYEAADAKREKKAAPEGKTTVMQGFSEEAAAAFVAGMQRGRAAPKVEQTTEETTTTSERTDKEPTARELIASAEATLKEVEKRARELGVDLTAPPSATNDAKILSDAKKRAAARIQGEVTRIATERAIAGKRELTLDELRERARRSLAKQQR